MELNDYQQQTEATNSHIGKDPIGFYLLGLAGEVGTVAAEYKKRMRDGIPQETFNERAAEEIGDILWYLAALARECGFDLDDIARQNLFKTRNRWIGNPDSPRSLDAGAPPEQQLPRRFSVDFFDNADRVTIFAEDGKQLGAHLNDNSMRADNYRFHDAFHLANAAVLGWSPVFRSMIKRKRKYDSRIDDGEDGARAIFVEEGLAAIMFQHAVRHRMFDRATQVDSEILQQATIAVTGLEVSVRTHSEWESAILQGFEVFNALSAAGGGRVTGDLDQGVIYVEATPTEHPAIATLA